MSEDQIGIQESSKVKIFCIGCLSEVKFKNNKGDDIDLKALGSNSDSYKNKDWPAELLYSKLICPSCIDEKRDSIREKSERDTHLFEENLKNLSENSLEEKQYDIKCKVITKKKEIIESTHLEKINKIKDEKFLIGNEILNELALIEEYKDEIDNIEAENYLILDEIYKHLYEKSILELECKEAQNFNPVLETFCIEVYQDFASIRQYEMKFNFLSADSVCSITFFYVRSKVGKQ